MPTPVSVYSTPGALIGGGSGVSVAAGKNVAALLDAASSGKADMQVNLTFQIDTGATPPSSPPGCYAFDVYGAATANPLTAAATQGATSLAVTSAAGLRPNQQVLLQRAGTPPQPGEVVRIGSSYAVGSLTVPLAAGTSNSYAIGDQVYLITQSTPLQVSPGTSYAGSSDYSAALKIGTGLYGVAVFNNDGTTNAITVAATADAVPQSFA